jgi:hypothetical protein
LTVKQDQLVRYDQNLHQAEVNCKYAKEECLIQEKEIIRLNTIQEEQENKINILQQDLLKLQEQVFIQHLIKKNICLNKVILGDRSP